ncbi:isopenicillin N synthase family oxygenase [Glutamicibacter mishrai]|uniref:Isopenicillin N synthase family oxygenase n=1 Tax=Glutamicibacter mishrai TaxID=1775880 RepID=A0A6H0SIB7_9MICC|nr:2-oxoglutarate and iron-dependent oxygenase domain-containing protein [Glutamicibacter mishrai]KUM29225.1 2OG-Fe(II) oxygenase [Arthrobacter sp. EpRS66]QIV87412.1 isopenicillin N synthase family oxygenase [Glutamicibacter mishrai]UTT40084.1 isopenicillin N synthase family oxygenase [Glutamicibacter mishrai]
MKNVVTEIPVLDISTSRNADGSFNEDFVAALRDAAHRVGFFQIVGYSSQEGQDQELLDTIAEFFNKPVEQKIKLDNRNSAQFRGYTRMGTEITRGRADAREQIDYGPERDTLAVVPADKPYLNLQGPNQFPEDFPQLEERAMAWAELMNKTGHELLSAIAVGLGLPEDHFDEPFANTPSWMGKLVHYVSGDVVPESGNQGVGLHADYGFVTLLLQDQVGGLQVQPYGQEEWIEVPPTPGALVVNLGEMLEVATDGYLMATIHRVIAPPAGVDRYSVPFFYSPRLDAVIDKVELPAELAAEARGVSDDPENPMLASYGANVLKGWLRAHPQTAAIHYPEVVKAKKSA